MRSALAQAGVRRPAWPWHAVHGETGNYRVSHFNAVTRYLPETQRIRDGSRASQASDAARPRMV
jgi:hypothetical protein